MTLKQRDKQAGKEPDECYCLYTDKDIPDLAIEVIYTSGGIDTLEIYRRIGIITDLQYTISKAIATNKYSKVNYYPI